MKRSNIKVLSVTIAIAASMLACNSVYLNQADRAATQIAATDGTAQEQVQQNTPPAGTPASQDVGQTGVTSENDPSSASGKSTCEPLEVFEVDVRHDDELAPDVIVYANGEEMAPPDGFSVNYSPLPNSARMSNTARVLVQDGAQITASTSQAVNCVGVVLIGDLITPASIYLDGELVWNGFLYPLVGEYPRPYRFFYIRFAVEPARPVSISITANSTGDDSLSIWVPVEAFGFDLP